ncbi:hypothetical protein Pcar_0590 [Syntrophotalea carbinolica DSM 2380]|uniref:Uncharacterized protein n=1 Tax=Syntrophotalea carbinolica (strain DSM 2380 / NBRC 103641 / GraBd1) TaxID=338963 RepID=Q3A702_SYNC1|nr:hypothetical protein [Syntrophotalea carbinolica]ABA87849.1 hypothetical protein Pcar_0590 [Syntrophotalea carbinolica DSM 2380]
MTVDQIKQAVNGLSPEEKKTFILETLPGLAKDAMQDSSFLLQLFPVFMNILKDSGIELSQLLQLAGAMGAQQTNR